MVHVLCKILKHNQNFYSSIVTGFLTSVNMQRKNYLLIYFDVITTLFVSETLPNRTSLRCWYHENSKGNLRLKHEAATQQAVSCWFTVLAWGKKLIRVIMINYAHLLFKFYITSNQTKHKITTKGIITISFTFLSILICPSNYFLYK